jgi:phage terminase small subunit
MGRSNTPAKRELSVKEQKFVDAILSGSSAVQADIAAGFSAKVAGTEGPKRLRKPWIRDAVHAGRAKLASKTEALQDRLLAELERIAFANIGDFVTVDDEGNARVDLSNVTRDQMATLSKIETSTKRTYTPAGAHIATQHNVKIAKEDKLRSIHLLGQTLGMFKQEELKVTVDVADRLLAARQRYDALAPASADQNGEA